MDDAVRLHVDDYGTGAPVLLVHGWPLSARFWEPQLEALVDAGYRAVCYDGRGYGRSDRPWDGHTLDGRLADLSAVVERLDLTSVTVVGFGTGCAEALAYAARSPRVAKLVLAGPLLFPGPLAADLLCAGAVHRIPMLDDALRRFCAADGQAALDEQTRLFLLRQACDASPRAVAGGLRAWRDADPSADLERVSVPVLVMAGGCDAFDDSAARVAAAVGGSRLVVVPGAPHLAPTTHPEEWNGLLLEWLPV